MSSRDAFDPDVHILHMHGTTARMLGARVIPRDKKGRPIAPEGDADTMLVHCCDYGDDPLSWWFWVVDPDARRRQ